jgi:hypothetical protein
MGHAFFAQCFLRTTLSLQFRHACKAVRVLAMSGMRQLLNGPDVLKAFLLLYALRRFCTLAGHSYADARVRWPRIFAKTIVWRWRITTQHPDGDTNSEIAHEVDFWSLLTKMKLNMEDLDWSTTRRAEIFDLMGRMTARKAWTTSLAMWYFGSRTFLNMLHAKASAGKLSGKRAAQVICTIIKTVDQPWKLFCRAFIVGKCKGNQVRRCRRPHLKARKMWVQFEKKHGFAQNASLSDKGLCRRHVLSALGRRMSAFSGKCFFQTWRQSSPRKKCFRAEPFLHMYSETGPGARFALNVLEGLPRSWCARMPGQTTADVYSAFLVKWFRTWRSQARELLRDQALQFLSDQLRYFSETSFDELGFQFALCELSKTENFAEHGSMIYEREYHRRHRV